MGTSRRRRSGAAAILPFAVAVAVAVAACSTGDGDAGRAGQDAGARGGDDAGPAAVDLSSVSLSPAGASMAAGVSTAQPATTSMRCSIRRPARSRRR